MSFNSILFCLAFLPFSIVGYYALALSRLHWLRLPFLILATVVYYAFGSVRYLPLMVTSVGVNYFVGTRIVRSNGAAARAWLWIGVLANVAALFWFKYMMFVTTNLSALFEADFIIGGVTLPLGISFYTFQQISFLVDLSRRRFEVPRPVSYFSYILFFPQLLAGPISLAREIVPQMERRPQWPSIFANLLIGLTIFSFGLFKKTVVADTAALWTGPIFDGAAAGARPSVLTAWGAALAYTLQIYFDFSGYSDMAIGVARMFGILLPLNFHSPLRSTSIIELWRRWHMTLGRFVQTYIFQPMVLPLARFCGARGLGGKTSLFIATLLPMFISMLIIGAWHGANWTFIVFGATHGVYMIINECWNYLRKKGHKKRSPRRSDVYIGTAITTIAFIIASVPFRAPNISTALRILAGMAGLNEGPNAWSTWPVLTALGAWGLYPFLAIGYLAIYLLPNTQQIMTLITPALEWPKWRDVGLPTVDPQWRPNAAWSIACGIILLLGIVFIARGTTDFVYFQF
jgi:alginate O-acetyltransferase complex protein AlgI